MVASLSSSPPLRDGVPLTVPLLERLVSRELLDKEEAPAATADGALPLLLLLFIEVVVVVSWGVGSG